MEFDIKSLFEVMWNKKVLLILVLIIFILLGVMFTLFFIEPEYSSSTTLILSKPMTTDDQNISSSDFITQEDVLFNQRLVSTYAEIMRSYEISSRIKKNLNLDISEETISKKITVSSVNDTVVIRITVKDEDAQLATDIANEAAKVFGEEIERIYKIQNISIVDKAKKSDVPYNINHVRDLAIFMLIGFIADICISIFILNTDTTIKSVEEIEKEYGIPVLGTIARFDDDVNKCADKLTVKKKGK